MWEPNGPDLSVASKEQPVLFCVGLQVLLKECEVGGQSFLQRQTLNRDVELSLVARKAGWELA